jgi:signal transduction histidine kinase
MGANPGEHVGQLATELYRDFPLMLENVRRALAGEEFSSTLEFASTVFECRYTPLHDPDGTPAGFIAVAHDITERSRLQRQILEISDREQARIGQDVHDGLCQQLIGMGFTLASLEESLPAGHRTEASLAVRLNKLLDEAIDEARRVCRGLYPVRLRTQGLQAALEEMALGATARYGVHCVCEPGNDAAAGCDVATATHLYRIAQEAVNNALKHSGARNVSIRLSHIDGETSLEVKDDGKGLGNCQSKTGGMGLHIMEYRARLIGGNLRWHSDSTGTVVSCRMPQVL